MVTIIYKGELMDKKITMEDIEATQEHLHQYHADLRAGLGFLFTIQCTTSAINPGCIPELGTTPTPDQLRTYFMALVVETSELLQELNWKPWKRDKAISSVRVADEFADILAFLGIILVYLQRLGISLDELTAAYESKTEVNIDRFLGRVEGYGVTPAQGGLVDTDNLRLALLRDDPGEHAPVDGEVE